MGLNSNSSAKTPNEETVKVSVLVNDFHGETR